MNVEFANNCGVERASVECYRGIQSCELKKKSAGVCSSILYCLVSSDENFLYRRIN